MSSYYRALLSLGHRAAGRPPPRVAPVPPVAAGPVAGVEPPQQELFTREELFQIIEQHINHNRPVNGMLLLLQLLLLSSLLIVVTATRPLSSLVW